MRCPILLATLALASSLPVSATAQDAARTTAAILRPAGEVDDLQRADAIDGVADALQEAGLSPLRPGIVESRLASVGMEACREDACAFRVRLALALREVVTVRIDAGQVTVRVASDLGQTAATVAIGDDGLRAAAARACADAHRPDAEPAPVELRLTGNVDGAEVRIDGRLVGTLPYRALHPPGSVAITVSAPGHLDHHVEIDIPPNATAPIGRDIALELEPDPLASDPDRGGSSEPSPYNYVVGGALLASAALLAISPLVTLARDGDIVDGDERVSFGAQSAVLLGLAGAALAGGVVFLTVQPIVSSEMEATGGALSMTGTF